MSCESVEHGQASVHQDHHHVHCVCYLQHHWNIYSVYISVLECMHMCACLWCVCVCVKHAVMYVGITVELQCKHTVKCNDTVSDAACWHIFCPFQLFAWHHLYRNTSRNLNCETQTEVGTVIHGTSSVSAGTGRISVKTPRTWWLWGIIKNMACCTWCELKLKYFSYFAQEIHSFFFFCVLCAQCNSTPIILYHYERDLMISPARSREEKNRYLNQLSAKKVRNIDKTNPILSIPL